MKFAQEPCHIRYVFFQELVEHNHMSFFTKEYIVGKVLNNLRDHHKTTPKDSTISFRELNVHDFRCHHRWGDESVSQLSCENQPLKCPLTAGK